MESISPQNEESFTPNELRYATHWGNFTTSKQRRKTYIKSACFLFE